MSGKNKVFIVWMFEVSNLVRTPMVNTVCECSSVSNSVINLGIASFTMLDSSQGLKVGDHV